MTKTAYTLETNRRIKFIVAYAPIYGQARIRSRHYTRKCADATVERERGEHGEQRLFVHEVE